MIGGSKMPCMQLICLSFGFCSLWDIRNGHCKENVDSNLTAHIGQEWPFFIVPEQSEKLMKPGNGTLRPWLLADDQIVSVGAVNHSGKLGSAGRSTRKNGSNVQGAFKIPVSQYTM
ncbi:uncharacterized protein LOC126291494 [Schistocerca gregaria]|uniref:uncharacterized protein LOC126291494 n=1 Tax=Schistocerca gregaria TaxID=7010 RepID=UPI00211DDB33|nr:uncharacterized protein LOC126291494 [Schistocerca gregaria]